MCYEVGEILWSLMIFILFLYDLCRFLYVLGLLLDGFLFGCGFGLIGGVVVSGGGGGIDVILLGDEGFDGEVVSIFFIFDCVNYV